VTRIASVARKRCPRHLAKIIFVLGFVAPPASGQAGFPPGSTIQVHLEQLVNSHGVTGVVVGLLAEDGTRRVIAHGDPGAGAPPLGGESVFEIGSMTKVFTGILLADMVRRGEVKLADRLADLLPPHVSVPARSGKFITLLDLTTHFSGLPMMPPNLAPADPENPFADYTVSQLYESVSTYELQRGPGDVFEYSNLGVALLGHALSLRAGTTYEVLVSERILRPLGMTHTAVTSTSWMEDHLVRGHDRAGNPVSSWDFPTTAGMGGLRSTANDMLTFAAANLAAADPSSEDTGLAMAMRNSHRGLRQVGAGVTYPGIPMAFEQGRVGFNWFISRPGERQITWTVGLTGGYSSFLGLDLEARRAVVVLTNTGLNNVDFLGFHLLDPTVPMLESRESEGATVYTVSSNKVGRSATADVAIRGGTVVDVTSGSLVPDQTVLIAGNRIVAVGPSDEVGIASGADVVDAAGGYLIPGLWDMHVHSVRKAAAAPEEGAIANVDWHFPLFLAHGVTGVRNMNDATADPTLELTNSVRRRLADGELVGPRLLAPGPFVDGHPPLGEGAVVVRTAAEARAVVDSLADAGADFIKPYENLSRDAYFALMDQARRRGIPVDGHLPFRVTAEEAAAAGQRTVEHPEVMAPGCSTDAEAVRDRFARMLSDDYANLPDDEQFLVQFRLYRAFYDTRDPAACEPTLEAFRRHDVAVTMDVIAYHHIVHADEILADTTSMRLVPPAVRRDWEARAAGERFRAFQSILRPIIPLELENVRLLHEAGVTLLAATDAGVALQVPGISLHRQLLRLTEAGLTPLEALRAATLNPARVLGLTDSLGTIEAGKLADLVLLDANPLADIRNTQRIRAVIADGRLYRRADLDRLLAEVEGLESADRKPGENNR
jgi:serine-type D-Ala-D-Ala carboxypeptidase/endopeptidase